MADKILVTVRRIKKKPDWVSDGMSVNISKDITVDEILEAINIISFAKRNRTPGLLEEMPVIESFTTKDLQRPIEGKLKARGYKRE